MKKLIIGCANFGNKYGLNKKSLGLLKIYNIIKKAKKFGINHFDTAQDYNKSEVYLGKILKKIYSKEKLLIDTKLSKRLNFKNDHLAVEKSIKKSLANLKIKKINILYVHDTKQLLRKDGKILFNQILNLKKIGLINKIGVSIYTLEEAKEILKKFKIDFMQIPFNVLDNRFISIKFLRFIKLKKCKLIVRSLFLKGLILKNPNSLSKYFEKWKRNLSKINNKFVINRLSIKEWTLKYVNRNKNFYRFIIGISDINQLNEIIKILKKKKFFLSIPPKINIVDKSLLNPKLWKID